MRPPLDVHHPGNGWYKAKYGLNSKSGQMMWTLLCFRENKMDYIVNSDKMI